MSERMDYGKPGDPMDPEYDPPCTNCDGTGVNYQTERRCACTLTEALRAALTYAATQQTRTKQ